VGIRVMSTRATAEPRWVQVFVDRPPVAYRGEWPKAFTFEKFRERARTAGP